MANQNGDIKKNTLDNSVLKSIISCSCGLILAGAAISWFLRSRLPERFTEGFLVGALGGLANLYFLRLLITSTIHPTRVRKSGTIAGLVGLHASLFVLLYPVYRQWVDSIGMVVGFTLILCLILVVVYRVVDLKGNE